MRISRLSVGELAALVCEQLARQGIEVVLSGGSCVAIYSAGKYVSKDLDFVLTRDSDARAVRAGLRTLGFKSEGRFFVHSGAHEYIDVLPPPLAVGSEAPWRIETLEFGGRTLRLLSATDCVKDRLAAWFFWSDRQALEQAVLVALAQSVNLRELRRWSVVEGETQKYEEFVKLLRKRRIGKPGRRGTTLRRSEIRRKM